ncbi:DUF86 domain-containing protein [Arcanobacterium canis]|uniref:DUF86 domain-containing protein n=1 Tax=Arcanobacterium canis TaxID=999183 RepID=A0ABY8G2D2_9ACTO|nr:HepT-like ribonuclease domain-containing protein [Arcanobacterium canis]WFM83699.1 DUF86 domain-containing protein [Arcanobacterium canis]
MSRTDAERVVDILFAIEKCQRYIENVDSGSVELSEMASDAIERNLQIIGEAVNHLSTSITDQFPEIPWPQIRGFRNILVHQYFGVDFEVVREVVEIHLEPLASALSLSKRM